MDVRPTTLERAFALADSGRCMSDIRYRLTVEGYDQSELNSLSVRRQLYDKISAAKAVNGQRAQ